MSYFGNVDELSPFVGLKICALLIPVFLLFVYLGKADVGLVVVIVVGVMTLAIRLRWNLRRHVWFWLLIVFILALHVPLFLVIRWPQESPTLTYTMPFGLLDFLIISGTLCLAEKLLARSS